MTYKYRLAITVIAFLFQAKVIAQQNHSMYLQHYLPESNLLNPAIPIDCKWYLGLPVISSTHLNFANSGFSLNQVLQNDGSDNSSERIDRVVNKLGRRNILGSEVHLQWFALGYRHKNHSFFFTLTEKNNVPFTYPKSIVQLLWKGNSMFEGEEAGLKGTGLYFNHYREYAFTYSRYEKTGIFYGIRAKLLFGKLNISSRDFDIGVMTDETTFNLNFFGHLDVNTSLPITVSERNGLVDEFSLDENVNPLQLLLNRKNPGFAVDAGIIYPYNKKLELSASVIDIGFIRWRSNLNNFEGDGNFFYDGALGQTDNIDTYIQDISESIVDSFEIDATQNSYTSFLPPRLLAGAKYTVNTNFDAGANAEAVIYRTKIVPSLTFSGHYKPLENIHLLASYSFQYSSYNNIGLGFVLGRNPVQFYAITDNIGGFFWPLNARNINLRFGLNLIFGCNIKDVRKTFRGALDGNCACYDDYRKPKRRR